MISLEQSNCVIEAIFARGRELGCRPLSVVVVEPGAKVKAFQKEDGSAMMRREPPVPAWRAPPAWITPSHGRRAGAHWTRHVTVGTRNRGEGAATRAARARRAMIDTSRVG